MTLLLKIRPTEINLVTAEKNIRHENVPYNIYMCKNVEFIQMRTKKGKFR